MTDDGIERAGGSRDTVRLGVFTRSVLVECARRSGRLADAGLEVVEEAVASSPAQFRDLAEGRYDAVVTSPDNAIAYRFLDANPLGARIDVVVTAALDRGLGLAVCARPGLTDAVDVHRFGVDVATSGFAFAGAALLAARGADDAALETVALGATPKRVAALLAGECDATVLGAGNELAALDAGAVRLGRIVELGPYLGAALARLRAGERAAAADRLAAVLVATAGAIRRRELDATVLAAAGDVLGLPPHLAAAHLEILTDEREGFVADGVVDEVSVATLVALRARRLPDPALASVPARLGELTLGLARG